MKRPALSTLAMPTRRSAWPYFCDLRGDEEKALDLYKECLAHPPVHASALMNMAVLYDDAGKYERAMMCLESILAANPNHMRAKLFLKDAQGLADDVLRRRAGQTHRPPQRRAGHPGDRFRAFRPRPQLPQEDEHPLPGATWSRPPRQTCWPTRTSARHR